MEEDPHDVLRPFLVHMKRSLSIDSLKIYLLAENVINDDDMVKLTVTAQHSRSEVVVNLRDIVRRRNVLDKFLKALKRSFIEENNLGHKELYEMINNERKQRTSMQNTYDQESGDDEPDSIAAAQKSKTGECVMDMNDEKDDEVIKTLTQKYHSTGQQLRKRTKGTQTSCVCVGLIIAGLIVTGIVLLALGVTIVTFGVYGILGEDDCTRNLTDSKPLIDTLSGFNITLGTDAVFLGMILVLFVFVVYFHGLREDNHCINCHRVLVGLIILFIVLFVFASIVVFCFGIGTSVPIFGFYSQWKRESVNCSSPVFYIPFVYLIIQYSAIALTMIGAVAGFVIKWSIGIFCTSS